MFSKTFSCKCLLVWFQSLTPLTFSGNLWGFDSCVQYMDLVFFTSYNETQVSLVKEVLDVSGTWLKKDEWYVNCFVPCVSLWLVSLFHSFRMSLMSQSLMVLQWASLLSSVTMTQVQFTTNVWESLPSLKGISQEAKGTFIADNKS